MSTPKRLAKYKARREGKIPPKPKPIPKEAKNAMWVERMKIKGVYPK